MKQLCFLLGRGVGLFLLIVLVKPMRWIYGRKKVVYLNADRLSLASSSSMIVASNHIKPRNKFLAMLSMPYDAFLARAMFLKYGIYSTAIASYDAGKIDKKTKQVPWSAKCKEMIIKGIVLSLDLIPLNRNESDPDTLKSVRSRIAKQRLGIGIFPEGTYFRGYRRARKIHPGFAVFARRYGVPVLPIFLFAYNLGGPLVIAIGNPLEVGKDYENPALLLRREWDTLEAQVKSYVQSQVPIKIHSGVGWEQESEKEVVFS